jgi:biopolymer transport protein ExbD
MSMNMRKKGYQSDINITPYIDILLVLLIIFMVAAPVQNYDHPVRIPQPPSAVQPKLPVAESVIVDMNLDHSVTLNKEPVTLEELESTLTQVLSRTAVRDVFVRGDSALPYGDIFVILDIARRSGASNIALLKKNAPRSTAEDEIAGR